MTLIAFLFLLPVTHPTVNVPSLLEQEITKEVFLREAPKGWAKLEDAAFQGSVTLRHSEPNGQKVILCEFRDGKARFDLHFSGYSPTTIIGTVDNQGERESTAVPAFAANMLGQEVYDHLRAPFSIYGVPIRKLLADPAFKVVQVSKEPDGKVKATFEYPGDRKDDARRFYTRGWCVVDPKKSWAITRVFIENPNFKTGERVWHPKMERVVEYTDGDAEVPSLKRHRLLRPDGTDSIIGEILRSDSIPVPLERFASRNMGWPQRLHDIVESVANSRSLRWYIAGVMLATIAFAIWMRRWFVSRSRVRRLAEERSGMR
jgi:hypothetical protein